MNADWVQLETDLSSGSVLRLERKGFRVEVAFCRGTGWVTYFVADDVVRVVRVAGFDDTFAALMYLADGDASRVSGGVL
jgi:hypothetical protein